MTSATLANLFAGTRWAGDEKVSIAPDEVYYAATSAQKEILSLLNILEGRGGFTLAANQEMSTYPALPITNVVLAGSVTNVTITGHAFHTGDEGYLYGILGAVQANGRWTFTRVNANTISIPLAAVSAYISGGTAIHILAGAKEMLPSGIRRISDSSGLLFGSLDKKTLAWVEANRYAFSIPPGSVLSTGNSGSPTPQSPNNSVTIGFYEIYTDPITIGIFGPPQLEMITEARFYRKHIDGVDDISATVNPIIPSFFDETIKMGVLYYLFAYRGEKGASVEASKWRAMFDAEMMKARKVHGRQKLVQQADTGGRW